jgi:hypothetical protein
MRRRIFLGEKAHVSAVDAKICVAEGDDDVSMRSCNQVNFVSILNLFSVNKIVLTW